MRSKSRPGRAATAYASRLPIAIGLLLGLIAITQVSWAAAPASPQATPSASASPAPAIPDARSVVSLLDAVIGWYRGSELEPQMVQEPREVLFVSQDRPRAAEILKLAFQYARAEAAALESLGPPASSKPAPPAATGDVLAHPEVIQSRHAQVEAEIAGLQTQIQQLQKQIAAAPKRKRDALSRQLASAQGELQLAQARAEFLDAMSQFEIGEEMHHAGKGGALLAQIDELEHTVPTTDNGTSPNVRPQSAASQPSGLVERTRAWFKSRAKIDRIGRRIYETAQLNQTIRDTSQIFRQNLVQIDHDVHALVSQEATDTTATPAQIEARKKQFQALLARHKLLGDAALPLTKISLLLVRYQNNLQGWRDAVTQRAIAQLYAVVTSAVGLAVVLGLLIAVGYVWRRLAFHYVDDTRRRSQMLQVRNVVIGLLIAIVLAFEFVSAAGSLATVIGLGTAGIAVALQDVILSIAGYFRLGGRFGIKVGDWVELQGVHGEVIDIGLTKLTMMELAGEGEEREPTGRLVVMSNSTVFRDKFANRAYGTSLGWDEVELTISPDCDYRLAEKRVLEVVDEVFAHYRDVARAETREMERRFNLRMEPPRPQSRLLVADDAVRLNVRYPVNARVRTQVADEISRRLLDSFKREPTIRLMPRTVPILQPAVPPSDSAEAAPEPSPVRAPLRKA